MRNRKLSTIYLFTALVLTVVVFSVAAEGPVPEHADEPSAVAAGTGIVLEPKGATGEAVYIVRLQDDPLATYSGGISTFAPTSPSALGSSKLDVNSVASTSYLEYLAAEQAVFLSAAGKALDRDVEVIYQYDVVYNGVAVILAPEEASVLSKIPGVVNIQRDNWHQKQTDVTPSLIGATNIWNGSAVGGAGVKGEGIIVGVIDTGIWPEHPSFVDDGSYLSPDGWLGGCSSPSDASQPYSCNNKLIGAKYFLNGYGAALGVYDGLFNSARDDDGHGTHTASTAAGNEGVAVTLLGVDRGNVSGIAPRAHVAMYKGLGPQGGVLSDLVAAINAAVGDGVDVINYSIGGGARDPWVDAISVAFLAARNAGVFVATSAGNSGPNPATIGSPGDAPWLTAVGASTSNRQFISDISLSGPNSPPSGLYGASVTAGVSNFNLVDAEGIADSNGDASGLCLNPFPVGTFSANDVVLCKRGQIARVLRGAHIQAGGGGGVILYNPEKLELATDNYVISAVHVENDGGQKIKDYITDNPGQVMVSFTAGQKTFDSDPRVTADMMGAFSSRGPNGIVPEIIKPNITAPGVQILAGASPQHVGAGAHGEFFQSIQGTSMSSPHVAGAAALLMAVHADWTAAEIESALMTTANTNHVKDDGVTPADPFDIGAGRIDLNLAALAPLVMDETHENYIAADPNSDGDPKTLNIASLGNNDCVNTCGWTRTLRNTTNVTMSWEASLLNLEGTVAPSSFTLDANETVSITISVGAAGLAAGEWAYGSVDIVPQSDSRSAITLPSTHMPIAIIPDERLTTELVTISTRRDAGSYLMSDLIGPEITQLTIDTSGLVPAKDSHIMVEQDPTEDDPFDDLDRVWWTVTPVSAGATRLVNEIRVSDARDVDLYVGYDGNGNKKPDADEEVCSGIINSWAEYCNVELPQEGDWWVLVQNVAGSGEDTADSILLATAVVANQNEGNMMFDAPLTVPPQNPFDVRIKYDLMNTYEGQEWYGSFSIGTDPGNLSNVARVEVNLYRVGDDVVKLGDIVSALPGDMITYSITVNPNILNEDVTYQIVDLIPDGMTYVHDSAHASGGIVNVSGNELTWSGTLNNPNQLQPTYKMSTSATDETCDTGFEGYINLEDHGIFAQQVVQGDGKAFEFFGSGNPITFFDLNYDSMFITDDGFAVFDPGTNYKGSVWNPQVLPDLNKPSNVASMMWKDMNIVYDKELNHGVSAATVGASVIIVEYDNIQTINDAANNFDFEIVMTRVVDDSPGAFEIVFAYDNLNGTLAGPLTIGLENAAGDTAVVLVNRSTAESVISDGFMVCFDAFQSTVDPVIIGYQVTVDDDMELGVDLINRADSTTSSIGSK